MANTLFEKTWSLVPDKSIFSASFNPTNETRVYNELKNGYKLTVEGSNKGAGYKWSYTAFYDGKPHPVSGRDDVDHITIQKLDDDSTGGWFTKDGTDVAAYKRKKTAAVLVVTACGRLPNGSTYFDTITYT